MPISGVFDVSNKVAFVTGAGSGLGRAMSESGATVVLVDIDKPGLAETEHLLSRFGGKVLAIVGDASNEKAVDLAVERVSETFGGLDTPFNNAGIGDPEPGLLHEHERASSARTE